MTRNPGLFGLISGLPVIRRPLWRRVVFFVVICVCFLLALYPERYRAAVTLTPTDPSSLGLSATLGQLGAVNSVFGDQAKIEIAIKIARSLEVRQIVAQQLKLSQILHLDALATDRWLTRKVNIRSLRGGILQIETFNADANLGKKIVGVYADATRQRLGEISRSQTAYKRDVLDQLVHEAGDRMQAAQTAYDAFRLRTRNTEPNYAVATVTARVEGLRNLIKAKQVQLNSARQFATDENQSVRQILAEIEALTLQLSQAKAVGTNSPDSVGEIVTQSKQLRSLERELAIARGLYDGYTRYLEGTAVEDLTSTANVRILEPPFIDTERQYNFIPLAAGLLLLMLALAIEFYRLRPPVGSAALNRV